MSLDSRSGTGSPAPVSNALGSRYAALPEWVHRLGRSAKSALGLLRPTRNRSYWHGYLFDRQGGVYRTDGLEFAIPDGAMPRSYRSRFYFDVYEAPERKLVRKYVKPDSTILEVGACIGVVSCVSNRMLDDGTRHVVVEANPYLIPTLTRNRDHNKCSFRIEHCVVGPGTEMTFRVSPLMTASSLGDRLGKPVSVKAQSIDAIQDRYGLRFDTLIADIEGGELGLFESHRHLLPQLRTVVIEVHPSILGQAGADRVRTMLGEAGLHLAEEVSGTEVWVR